MSSLEIHLQARYLARSGAGRMIREEADISVRQLARHLSVDVATLSRWERGECLPRGEGASRWVEACALIQQGSTLGDAPKERLVPFNVGSPHASLDCAPETTGLAGAEQ